MKFKHVFFLLAAVQAVCITAGVIERNPVTLMIAVPGFFFAIHSGFTAGEVRL